MLELGSWSRRLEMYGCDKCPNHPNRDKVFALAIDEGEPELIPESDNWGGDKGPSGEPDDQTAKNGEVEDCFVKDLSHPKNPPPIPCSTQTFLTPSQSL